MIPISSKWRSLLEQLHFLCEDGIDSNDRKFFDDIVDIVDDIDRETVRQSNRQTLTTYGVYDRNSSITELIWAIHTNHIARPI